MDKVVMENETALIKISPDRDKTVVALLSEVTSILDWARKRTITNIDDVKDATNDLSLISKLKKAVEEKRQEYTIPLNDHIKAINGAFKLLTEPLTEADKLTRQKVLAYNAEIERQRQEAEAIEQEKLELARREALLKGGEITIDLSPLQRPEATPDRVRAEAGMLSKMMVRKWEVEDLSKVPLDYLMIDAAKVGKVVRAGIPTIQGIRIWEEPTLRVTGV